MEASTVSATVVARYPISSTEQDISIATDDASLSGSKGNWDHMTIWACSPGSTEVLLMGVLTRPTVKVGTLPGEGGPSTSRRSHPVDVFPGWGSLFERSPKAAESNLRACVP